MLSFRSCGENNVLITPPISKQDKESQSVSQAPFQLVQKHSVDHTVMITVRTDQFLTGGFSHTTTGNPQCERV